MDPQLLPGAIVLIDRHYNSLQPYRKGELNMHTVRVKKACFVCYVELSARNIILRSHNRADSVEVIAMEAEKTPSRLSGRTICDIGIETQPNHCYKTGPTRL